MNYCDSYSDPDPMFSCHIQFLYRLFEMTVIDWVVGMLTIQLLIVSFSIFNLVGTSYIFMIFIYA